MTTCSPTIAKLTYSAEAISEQLQKIQNDEIFRSSDILKRFLGFIIKETLGGNANQLKEYTIAVKILGKPVNFNPQENGIVRIHAGRLRRALDLYYSRSGLNDPIRITIPRGNYVPLFSDNPGQYATSGSDAQHETFDAGAHKLTIALIPFRQVNNDSLEHSFAEGLGLQLSTALSQCYGISVVAYYTMKKVSALYQDVKQIGKAVKAQYLITGDIQTKGDCHRIYLQMINADNAQVEWSQMVECTFKPEELFNIQDDIIKQVLAGLDPVFEVLKRTRMKAIALHAVA